MAGRKGGSDWPSSFIISNSILFLGGTLLVTVSGMSITEILGSKIFWFLYFFNYIAQVLILRSGNIETIEDIVSSQATQLSVLLFVPALLEDSALRLVVWVLLIVKVYQESLEYLWYRPRLELVSNKTFDDLRQRQVQRWDLRFKFYAMSFVVPFICIALYSGVLDFFR